LRETLRAALAFGVASGCLEVALRAESRLGLSAVELTTWLLLSVLAGLAVALPAAVVAGLLSKLVRGRSVGLMTSALLALHVGLWYRFEVVLNEFVRSPKVWGGMLGIAFGSLVACLLLDKVLRKAEKPAWGLAVVAALAAFALGSAPGPLEGDGPNVLLITLDTTRPDRLGPYGGPAETPTLDRLAREGVVFEQAIAPAPLTEPSHLSIFTGMYVHGTGVVSNGTDFAASNPALLPDMLQARFQEKGYRTGGFVSGFPLHGKWGWLNAFDVYDDDFGDIPGLHRLSLVRLWEQIFLPGNTLRERYGQFTTARTLSFLKPQAEGQWFAWMHLFDPHAPYEVSDEELAAAPRDGEPLDLPAYLPPPYRTITDVEWIIDTYDREISKADRLVGEVIAELEARGVLDDTIVIVTADHGESLTEHDYFFEHGDYLYDVSLRIPLIVRYPDAARAGERVPCQVSSVDILPTLVELVDLRATDAVQGRSLASMLRDGESCTDGPVVSATVAGRYMENPPVDRSLRNPDSKLIVHEEGRDSETLAFFDLAADPAELEDIAGSGDEAVDGKVAASRMLLDSLLEGNSVDVASPESDADTMQMLEQLGYIE